MSATTAEPHALAAPRVHSLDDVPVPLDLKVLVVDDNVDAADSLGDLLRLFGAEVEVRHDGRSALEVADRFHPDAALLDINMPGMDGCEVARRLHERAGDYPVLIVAVTAIGDPAGKRWTAESGFDAHLTKPAEPRAVVAALAEHRHWLHAVGVKN